MIDFSMKIIDFSMKIIDFSMKIIDFSMKIIDFSMKIIDFFFFLQRSATRSVHVSEKELQRSPELRGAKNLYERKPTPSNPGVGKTVARERYTLNRLLRKGNRKKAAGRQCTTAILNEGAPKGSTRVQRDRNAKAAA